MERSESSPGIDQINRRAWMPSLSRRDILEAAIIATAFLLYFWVRGAVVDRPESAYWHARDVVDVERTLGFFWEPQLNDWTAARHGVAQVMNVVYFYFHFPLIIAFGIWLYYYRRHQYTFVRDSFLASGAIALVIYWLFPVAPPRELDELAARYDPAAPAHITGFVDTMKEYLGYAYDTQSTRAFVNPYAAMPSLHFGWDFLLGLAIVSAFLRHRWFWVAAAAGIALPASQLFSITMTGNHFLLDAAVGGVVAVAGLVVARWLQRHVYPALQESLRRLPWTRLRRFLLADEEPADAAPVL